ncbi:MAG: Y-family DNA polymerase [Burkholderiaceae bacterium]
MGVHLPALSLESFLETLAPERDLVPPARPMPAPARPRPRSADSRAPGPPGQAGQAGQARQAGQAGQGPRPIAAGQAGEANAPRLARAPGSAPAARRPAVAAALDEDDDDDADPFGPVALVERHRLVAVNAAAQALGLQVGQRRATALAIAPHTRLGEPDPRRDAAGLQAVVHALMAFTPAVSIAEGHVVLAEVQASLRYFGGLPRLLERLRAALAALGHAVRVACAPTAQAAHWLSTWRDDTAADGPPPCTRAEWRACIGRLPVGLMAAAGPHLPMLDKLALRTVADLWRQPRAGLVRRFGEPLLADIDRATGELADPRVALEPAPVFDSRLELFMRADDTAALLGPAAVLLQRLTAWARARHGRISGFELRLHHETHRRMREDPATATTVIAIGLGEPVTDAAHLHALVRERLQRQPLAASVIELTLHCDAIAPGAPPNAELFPTVASADEGWQRLLERFEARLGAHNLQRLRPVADHCPERATAVAIGSAPPPRPAGRVVGEPMALVPPDPRGPDLREEPHDWPRQRRPVWLVDPPRPLREQAGTPLLDGRPLWLVAGPERIEADWWEDLVARDYFIAQADDGALLWVYRFRFAPPDGESGWYLQGRFG